MLTKIKNWWKGFRLPLRTKMTLSLSAIAVVLLLSSIISFLEYRRMSNYVSDLIAHDINSINIVQHLGNELDDYNLQVLTVIGDDGLTTIPDLDRKAVMNRCDSLQNAFQFKKAAPLADSVRYAYTAYMLASTDLESVVESTFIDSRDWNFGRLQPIFIRLRNYLDRMSAALYDDLQQNSENFDNGFYRSIIPSAVAVGVGILLVFLLMFFIQTDYVTPIYKMLEGLRNFRVYRHRYTYTFDGSDQLSDLNEEIREVTEDNRQLRRRNVELKEKQ